MDIFFLKNAVFLGLQRNIYFLLLILFCGYIHIYSYRFPTKKLYNIQTKQKTIKKTLDLRDDSTFLFTPHVGYLAGGPVNQSSAGTFSVYGDVVTFTGTNGITTIGHVQNGAILIEGTKFTKTE